jgi:hypothetical protein
VAANGWRDGPRRRGAAAMGVAICPPVSLLVISLMGFCIYYCIARGQAIYFSGFFPLAFIAQRIITLIPRHSKEDQVIHRYGIGMMAAVFTFI